MCGCRSCQGDADEIVGHLGVTLGLSKGTCGDPGNDNKIKGLISDDSVGWGRLGRLGYGSGAF